MNILIKNTTAILENEVLQTDIYISGDSIVSIKDAPLNFTPDKIFDGENFITSPGFINTHTHVYMSFLRNIADDLPFMEWLFDRIMPLEDDMTAEESKIGTLAGLIESFKCGVTCVNDMSITFLKNLEAFHQSGIRAMLTRGIVGSGGEDGSFDEGSQKRLDEFIEGLNKYKDSQTLNFAVGPHAPYTCDFNLLKNLANYAQNNNLLTHIHLSESESEVQQITEKYGYSPIKLCEETGTFRAKTILAHGVQLSDDDMDILKKYDVSVASNPSSNLKLGNGFAHIEKLLEKGINVSLGTDSAASNNTLNIFKDMYLMAMIHKGKLKDPTAITPKQVFKMATINGAKALGLEDITGSIKVGKKADIIMIDKTAPSLYPLNDIYSALIYSATGSEVTNVIINGKIVMENREVKTIDENKVFNDINNMVKYKNFKAY